MSLTSLRCDEDEQDQKGYIESGSDIETDDHYLLMTR